MAASSVEERRTVNPWSVVRIRPGASIPGTWDTVLARRAPDLGLVEWTGVRFPPAPPREELSAGERRIRNAKVQGSTLWSWHQKVTLRPLAPHACALRSCILANPRKARWVERVPPKHSLYVHFGSSYAEQRIRNAWGRVQVQTKPLPNNDGLKRPEWAAQRMARFARTLVGGYAGWGWGSRPRSSRQGAGAP
jgi:hypothetical protein